MSTKHVRLFNQPKEQLFRLKTLTVAITEVLQAHGKAMTATDVHE